MRGGATFSADRRYRYRLWREWDRSRAVVAFVMLNPSTADASRDDPTIRRCIGFARAWGFGGVEVANLFALRATDPRHLRGVPDPVGPRNARSLKLALAHASLVVVAWGADPFARPVRLGVHRGQGGLRQGPERVHRGIAGADARRRIACRKHQRREDG